MPKEIEQLPKHTIGGCSNSSVKEVKARRCEMVAYVVKTNKKTYGCYANSEHAENVRRKLFREYGIGSYIEERNVDVQQFFNLRCAYGTRS